MKSHIQKMVNGKTITGVQVSVYSENDSLLVEAGDLVSQRPYFIASTTKLYVTALALKFESEGKLLRSDLLATYLPASIIEGLHIWKGKDYSKQITIQHVMAQTSGLPDYFEGKNAGQKSLYEKVTEGNDVSFSFEEAIALSKTMKPHFSPGQAGKAKYSDTNYQLLGKVLETVGGKSIDALLKEHIFDPLQLQHTYMYRLVSDTTPADLHFKNRRIKIPGIMSSFGADGGIVSTSEESIVFIRAFFTGKFFPKEILTTLYVWNDVMFPIEYGIGLMRFKLPRVFMLFQKSPEFLGHSGLSGAFAYYLPEKKTFFAGTVNQINAPGTSYRLMMKLQSCL
ncbi:MAG: beta-lactamase family protein [Cytophagaceae bacterium]|nr:beta-lactamase family protein [Cytophagaceae bacterium]